jgi:hypothetical protein
MTHPWIFFVQDSTISLTCVRDGSAKVRSSEVTSRTIPKFLRQPQTGGALRLHPIHQRTFYLIRFDSKLPAVGDLP